MSISLIILAAGKGTRMASHLPKVLHKIAGAFTMASLDLWTNFKALFTAAETDWTRLAVFYRAVFLPYLVGGLIPGVIFGLGGYYLSLPVIKAYQNRRKGAIKAKLAALKQKAKPKPKGKAD